MVESHGIRDVKKSNVAFLSSQNRGTYPHSVPYNRLGNELVPIRGSPNLGPDKYDTDAHTNMIYTLNEKPCSKKGYSMGARTTKRFTSTMDNCAPSSTTYQAGVMDEKEFQPAHKPFEHGSSRFQREEVDETPPPGTYDPTAPRNRKVEWQAAFNGGPINLPTQQAQTGAFARNADKLRSNDQKRFDRRFAYLSLYF